MSFVRLFFSRKTGRPSLNKTGENMTYCLFPILGHAIVRVIDAYRNPPIVVSLGIDCGIADFLRKEGIRKLSFPFDWCVSGSSRRLTDAFKEGFPNWCIPSNEFKQRCVVNHFNVDFAHHDATRPDVARTFERRIKRLQQCIAASSCDMGLLASPSTLPLGSPIHFVRRSHSNYSHNPPNSDGNEVKDVQDLDNWLQQQKPKPNYKIWLFLCCHSCDQNRIVPPPTDTLVVKNLVTSAIGYPMTTPNEWDRLNQELVQLLPLWKST